MSQTPNNSDKPSILRTTREARGLTLEIIHEATKIPMDALRAIEEGYSVRILTPFYYKGFIKIYAEFLGLDVAETYKHYGIDQAPKPAVPVASKAKAKEFQPNIVVEKLQGAASVLKPKTIKLVFKVIGALLVVFVLVKISGCIAAQLSKKTSAKKQAQPVLPASTAEKKPKTTAPVVPEPAQAVSAKSINSKVQVAARAVKDTWFRVKADNRVVFESTLRKGSLENWSADKEIELSGKDIERLDLEINGKHVGSLGGGERRIRKVVITKEGLTVKK